MDTNAKIDVEAVEPEAIVEETNIVTAAPVENESTDDTSNKATESLDSEKPSLPVRRKMKISRTYRRSRSRGRSPARVIYRPIRGKSPSRCMRKITTIVETALAATATAASATNPVELLPYPTAQINLDGNSDHHTNVGEMSIDNTGTNENGNDENHGEKNESEERPNSHCHCSENVASKKTSKKERITQTLFTVASGVCRFVRYPLMLGGNAATLYFLMNSLGYNGFEYVSRAVSMLQPLVNPLLTSSRVAQTVTNVAENIRGTIPAALASTQYLSSATFK